MVQEIQDKKYEIKIIKEVEYLPNVFLIRHTNGQITKIVSTYQDFIDCDKDNNTISGCYHLEDGELKETKEIYDVPGDVIFLISSREKLIKDRKHAKNVIITTLSNYGLIDKDLLITYNEHEIQVYDKFSKGQLYEFPVIYVYGNLEVYQVPPSREEYNFDFEFVNILRIADYELEFSKEVSATEFYAKPGKVYLIYTKNITDMIMSSPDQNKNTITLHPNKYYLITLPNVIEGKEEG